MKEEQKNNFDDEYVCWQSIPIQYDDFPKENRDQYEGGIFGNLTMFESPHFLWRRFHKNYCKAILLTKLAHYKLEEHEEDDELFEVNEILEENYSLEILARHNAIVFLVTAIETFLKDSFAEILKNVYPEKAGGREISKIIRKYNFQNLKSIEKAFNWLCLNFEVSVVDNEIDNLLQLRHKIIHESYYDNSYSKDEFRSDASALLVWTDNFEFFFNDNGYWDKILPKADKS